MFYTTCSIKYVLCFDKSIRLDSSNLKTELFTIICEEEVSNKCYEAVDAILAIALIHVRADAG